MAVDFLSDADSRFFGEGMLQNDDWGDPNLNSLDDFPSFLDTELSTDDLMREFNTESPIMRPDFYTGAICQPPSLIPMFDDHTDILGLALREENSLNRSSSSDSGIGSDPGVKHEPLSPASSFSSDSDSAGSNMDCQILSSKPSCLDTCIKLEHAPLTPPRDPNDIITPLSMHNFCQSNHSITTMPVTAIKTEPTTSGPCSSLKTKNGINEILNNKVKIVPKPAATTACLPTTIQNGTPGKPLVLTPDEFARLTAQGVLKFQPPVDVKPAIKTVPAVTTSVTGTTSNSHCYPHEPTMKVLKRQQRMIKNRESACLSRRRKKEYVSSLEERMKQFNNENDRLRDENVKLKQRVEHLTKENDQLRKTVPSKRTAATFLLAVMLVFSLNMGPISNVLLQSPDKSLNIPSNEIHHGRTLLSLIDDKDASAAKTNQTDTELVQVVNKIRSSSQNSTDYKEMLMKSLETLSAFTLCPTHFNRSESLRLANELTGWVLGHKSEMKQKEAERAQRRASKIPKRHRPLKVLKAAMEGKLSTQLEQPQANVGESKNYQVQLFNSHEKTYHDFLDAIQRRNDTFYVVSFRRDHLLLPATAHNKTMRPRMSLVMPAVSLNDTMHPPVGSVAMMQIDCEVMNTKLIHVTKSTVPKHLWETNNTMTPVEETEVADPVAEDDAKKWNLRYKPKKYNP